jgi:glycosyl transferase, family 25
MQSGLFDGVFYINLEHRKDRLLEIQSELEKMNLKAERFNAVKAPYGGVGCMKSHIEVLKMAKERGYNSVLILEDDFMFLVDRETFWKELKNIEAKSIDYDVIMLGCNLMKAYMFDDQLYKVLEAQTTSGYIVHSRMYDKLIETFTKNIPILEKTKAHEAHCDQCWKVFQPEGRWFTFRNRIGIQRLSYSDIENRVVSYGV